MANVTPSQSPGWYRDSVTINWAFTNSVVGVQTSQGNVGLAQSKYIAYDTLSPPNPFIAVTQDGKGNVVYDGGFPKLYNRTAPEPGSSFASLTGAYKYMYNAINWVSNKAKVNAGIKKVLVLNDSILGESYSAKEMDNASGFGVSLSRLFAAVGYQYVIKDRNDYAGGLLNAPLSELEQYNLVFFMSTKSSDTPFITAACAQDLATFRANGGGLIFITDHGGDAANATQAITTSGFFITANQVMKFFGAYFTGTVDRIPVNVGFLRSTYGDHPLYAGLLDTEEVAAGSSESSVVVTTYPVLLPGNVPATRLSGEGEYQINFLLTLSDGSLESISFSYQLGSSSSFIVINPNGDEITGPYSSDSPVFDLKFRSKSVFIPTMSGQVLINSILRGSFRLTGSGVTYLWLLGDPPALKAGDVVTHNITSPTSFSMNTTIARGGLSYVGRYLPAALITQSKAGSNANLSFKAAFEKAASLARQYFKDPKGGSNTMNGRKAKLREVSRMARGVEGPAKLQIYPTGSAYLLDRANADTDTAILVANTNQVYVYLSGAWGYYASAQSYLGLGRYVINTFDDSLWQVNTGTTIKQ